MSSPNEKLYDFLSGEVAPYKGALPDMWAKFLSANGYSNSPIQKGINQYLGDLGYTGIFAKRWAQWYNSSFVAGGGVPAYDPATALGAKLVDYWDALDFDKIVQSGGYASSWASHINSYAAVQGTGSAQPAYSATGLNGGPLLVADGIDDEMTLASVPWPIGAADCEIWWLGTQTAAPLDTTARVAIGYGGSGGSTSRAVQRAVVSGFNRGRAAANATRSGALVDFTGAHVIRARFLSSGIALEVDGVDEGITATAVTGTLTNRTRLFANASAAASAFYQGGGAWFGLMNAELTSGEASGLLAYLKSRGGIA